MFTRLRPKSLKNSEIKARSRKNRLKLAVLFGLGTTTVVRAAASLVSSQIGIGPSLLHTSQGDLQGWGKFGNLRWAAYQERLHLIAGLNLNAWQITPEFKRNSANSPIDGNDIEVFIGHYKAPWSAWAGVGAGQLRVYDRDASNAASPHQFLLQTTDLGASYDLYQAEYGKIDLSCSWRQWRPEKSWRSRYAFTMIEALQLEFGFKLLGW